MSDHRVGSVSTYLSFQMDGDVYAFPVANVLEVVPFSRVARIPEASEHLAGLVDLRGKGIPVMDLRKELGLAPLEGRQPGNIIIMEHEAGDDRVVAGVIVDAVSQIIELSGDPVRVSGFAATTRRGASLVLGVYERGGDFIIVLAPESVIRFDEEPRG